MLQPIFKIYILVKYKTKNINMIALKSKKAGQISLTKQSIWIKAEFLKCWERNKLSPVNSRRNHSTMLKTKIKNKNLVRHSAYTKVCYIKQWQT